MPCTGLGQGGEFEHKGQGKGRSLPLTPTPSPQIRRSTGSATLPAPAQGLILELLGGMEKCPQFSSAPALPRSLLRCPMQGAEGQDRLKAPLLSPLTLLSCRASPENSRGDSLCPQIQVKATGGTTGRIPSATPFLSQK